MNKEKCVRLASGLMTIAVAVVVSAAIAKDTAVSRLSGSAYDTDAIAVETIVRKQFTEAMRFGFHRHQAFRSTILGKPWRVLSVSWQLARGGDSHCVLATLRGKNVVPIDAMAGEVDVPPWSCDGEPALQIIDLNGDFCPEVLALYPMRPPSGEQFLWPLVLRCDAKNVTWAFDPPRSQRLRAALQTAPLNSLQQAVKLLRFTP
jgi:hypothetical protein